ncbi:MAG: right-handed parallel beta-helix repeat-containing protein [Lachnospiraceae bacterium]|nr:right-handed parallel beta-helix repeat-containing protein [Lachnospiraceae bacterium]
MRRRWLCLLLTMLLPFLFTGCTNKENEEFALEILRKGQDRRDAVLNSRTAIQAGDTFIPGETYTGTAYYVSEDGDDGCDGRTPETAWASIERVNEVNLQYGDAVFFERGGVWRNTTVETRPGVTYSAFGEGRKPRICASPENGGREDYWSLWYEGNDGKKIWLYHRDMPDCGAIVLDETQAAQKILGFWNGTEYLNYIGPNNHNDYEFDAETQLAQPAFDVKEQLSDDLTFFSQADSRLPDTLPIFLTGWNVEGECYAQTSVGPLYFRCDEGNPAAVYESIEFQTHTPLFDNVASECVLDNLFIGFAGDGVVTVNEGDDVTVQNCEIGWVGGIVGCYNTGDEMTAYGCGIQRLAGALGTSGSGTRFLNNYVHEMYHAGGGIEIFQEQKETLKCTEDVLISGNLFYHCASGVTFFNWDEEPNPEHQFKNCIYEDNYIMFTGMEDWLDDGASPAFVHEGGPNMQEGCVVRDNVFFGARTALVYIEEYDPAYFPEFRNNIYIQYEEYPYIFCQNREVSEIFSSKAALSFLKDEEGKALSLSKLPDGL